MDLETVPDTFEYPATPECQVNATDCSFDVDYLCHQCGRQLCANCAVGIRHQPQLFKYNRENDRTQVHCPDCADHHSWNTTNLGIAAGGVGIGLILLYITGGTPIFIALIAVILLAVGGYVGYTEYNLKKKRDMTIMN